MLTGTEKNGNDLLKELLVDFKKHRRYGTIDILIKDGKIKQISNTINNLTDDSIVSHVTMKR